MKTKILCLWLLFCLLFIGCGQSPAQSSHDDDLLDNINLSNKPTFIFYTVDKSDPFKNYSAYYVNDQTTAFERRTEETSISSFDDFGKEIEKALNEIQSDGYFSFDYFIETVDDKHQIFYITDYNFEGFENNFFSLVSIKTCQ